MSRSHPPSLITLCQRLIRDEALFARGDLVLVALSGGGDSMALLHVLSLLRKKIGHEVAAHGVDHGLRPEAAFELDLAQEWARRLGVPMARSRLKVAPGGNLQARAREARLSALRKAKAKVGAKVIATAHHMNDRAETILLRLLRGAGPAGLAVLPPRAEDLVRPMLHAQRVDVDAHLRRHAVPFATDPSNADPRFLRTQVRSVVLPLLEQLSPGIVRHLAALADQLVELPGIGQSPPFAHMGPLPRATREALTRLTRSRSSRPRVLMPEGLVARYDRAQLSVVVEKRPRDWKKR
jgi:tRNA(Ile)-lysidine synthase